MKLGPTPAKFGDQCTCDHLISRNSEGQFMPDPDFEGWVGANNALLMLDRATKYKDVFPTGTRSYDETIAAFQEFQGKEDTVQFFYSDGAPELIKAATKMKWGHDTSTPGVHESNALAER